MQEKRILELEKRAIAAAKSGADVKDLMRMGIGSALAKKMIQEYGNGTMQESKRVFKPEKPKAKAASPGYFDQYDINYEEQPKSEKESMRELLCDQHYIYDEVRDVYTTFLKSAPKPVVLSGTTHRAMKQAYSNWDGQPQTINQICSSFSFPRGWFIEYKAKHGWTHDSEPFTNEEILREDPNELTAIAIQQKRAALHVKYETAKYKETNSAAEKWWKLEESIKELQSGLAEKAANYKPPVLDIKPSSKRFAVVMGTYDLHFGKNGWADEVGDEYTREIAEKRLIEKTSSLIEKVCCYGRPEKFIVAVGSDFFHVDNYQGTTTNGTPQDMDGTPHRIMQEGCALAVKYVDLLRQVAPVNIVMAAGNHDYLLSFQLVMYLSAWFKNSPDVTISTSPMPRQYAVYGQTLMGFAHGDETKPSDFGALMSVECREHWSNTKHRTFFTGHLHSEMVKDHNGILQYQLPSLSGTDRWHNRKGYTMQRKATAAYLCDYDEGVTITIVSPVESDRKSAIVGL